MDATTNSENGGANNGGMLLTQQQQQEAMAQKKALEWELSLDSRDLRSHAWYHGPIPRQRAEEIVQREGDFLIRDCVSQPGNYVLTCRCKGPTLHFVINKVSLYLLYTDGVCLCHPLLYLLIVIFICMMKARGISFINEIARIEQYNAAHLMFDY